MPDEPKTSKITIITTKKKEKKVMIGVATKKGSDQRAVSERILSNDLVSLFKKTPDQLEGLEVEYALEKGILAKVWKKGGKWEGNSQGAPPRQPMRRDRMDQRRRRAQGSRYQQLTKTQEAFHNPYNFVPALPRNQVKNDLGDHAPRGHHAYHPDHWSGWLEVQLTTATPLLVPDGARISINDDDHKTFPMRVDANGAPYLPPTSLKGMLRAAYEIVTNSRFSIFEKHGNRLAFRMDARAGVEMVPAVVEESAAGLQLRLLPGSSSIGENGAPQNGLMYAAWLPRYQKYRSNDKNHQKDKHESKQALRYDDNSLPQHGDPVWVRCQQQNHRSGRFSFLTVTDIRQRTPGEGAPTDYQAGIVCITGRNMMNKHEERVFLLNRNDPRVELTPSLIEGWQTLVKNYQNIHADDLQKRRREGHHPNDYLGNEPGKTGWSHQIHTKEATHLEAGNLCYARITHQNKGYGISGLYPVMISRDLYKASPADLLPLSLHPASDYAELSPADRVFGWVNHKGKGAWRGQLRIEPANCEQGQDAIEHFGDDGVPLAILGEPKPQQNRFYAAHNRQGEPLVEGQEKATAYQDKTQGLRGRKVYPHHAHLTTLHNYWLQPREDRTQKPVIHQNKRYAQEYRRPTIIDKGKDKTRDNQNRSVLGWIKPNSTFRFKIHVSNLTGVELGALLWLLHLDKSHNHRLGSSKPLGFGSVHLKLENMELRNGQDWATFYTNFLGADTPCLRDILPHIETYKEAVAEAYGKPFEQISFIKAFKVALQGFNNGLPMHYPRLDEKPNPEGKSFEWFVQNERTKGPRLPLPSLEGQRGLPLLIP